MTQKLLSASTAVTLPTVYVSGANTLNEPLFAMMSTSLAVCLLMLALAAAASVMSWKPRLLNNGAVWLAAVLAGSLSLGLFVLSLASVRIGYALTYYFEPLDLAAMAIAGTALLLNASATQPASFRLHFEGWRAVLRPFGQWRLTIVSDIRHFFSAWPTSKPSRTA